MTKTIVEVLADTNDPESISTILENLKPGSLPVHESNVSDNGDSFSDHYQRFLSRRRNRSPATIAQYKRCVPILIDFVEDEGVRFPNQLNTGIIDDYVDMLQNCYDTDATILTYTKNARHWLKWLQDRCSFDESVYLVLNKDKLGLSPQARDEALPEAEAKHIIQSLRKKRRGSPQHAVMELLWNAGPRVGGVHSIDRCDLLLDQNVLKFRHRPQQGTRLKNGSEEDEFPGDGERDVTLSEQTVAALQAYIRQSRKDISDEHNRFGLFTTKYGRAARSTIRRWVYEATSCKWAPNTSDGPSCDGTCDPDSNVCPESYYPHAIRRGAIVNQLSNGLRPDRASERYNVGVETLFRHYDPRDNERRRQDRADAVKQAWSEW